MPLVLLNPLSSFRDSIVQLRGSSEGVHFVEAKDVIRDDTCGCSVADEDMLRGKYGSLRWQLCDNRSAFDEFILHVKTKEKQVILTRHEKQREERAKDGSRKNRR